MDGLLHGNKQRGLKQPAQLPAHTHMGNHTIHCPRNREHNLHGITVCVAKTRVFRALHQRRGSFAVNIALGVGFFSAFGFTCPVILFLAMRPQWKLFK
jgi:hypothetical protein